MAMSPAEFEAVREIFFLSSSRQTFASDGEREKFFSTWTEYYFKNCQELILLDRSQGHVRGYLMGCADSRAAEPFFSGPLPSYALFGDLFDRFPAHLHINVHPANRSQGVGARLIAQFCKLLSERGIGALHIVTSSESANREFYRRNGFTFEEERLWRGHALLFMGRRL